MSHHGVQDPLANFRERRRHEQWCPDIPSPSIMGRPLTFEEYRLLMQLLHPLRLYCEIPAEFAIWPSTVFESSAGRRRARLRGAPERLRI